MTLPPGTFIAKLQWHFAILEPKRWQSRGDEEALHDGSFWIPAGISAGRPGLCPLSRPAERQSIACPRIGTCRGTAVATESPVARAAILARSRPLSNLISSGQCHRADRIRVTHRVGSRFLKFIREAEALEA